MQSIVYNRNWYFCNKAFLVGRKPVKKKRIDDPVAKEKWVRLLLPIYIKRGLRHFSMDDVAGHLGISKATLYKHFSSREEIIEHALIVKLNDIGSFRDKLFDEDLKYVDRYFNAIHLFFSEISGISTDFLLDLKLLYPDIWRRVEFFRDYASDQLQAFYKQGIEQELFNNVSPILLVTSDRVFFDFLSDPKFLKDNNLSLQQAFHDYFKLRTKGLFKKQPPELAEKIEEFIKEVSS